MQNTKLDTCTLSHDGDFFGAMYLEGVNVLGKNKRIVVTRAQLEDELRAQRDKEILHIAGPCAEMYSILDIAIAPAFETLKVMDYAATHTLQVSRKDLQKIAVLYRTGQIIAWATDFSFPTTQPFAYTIANLDAMVAQLKSMQAS